MAKVLSLFRRKGGPEGDARLTPAPAPPPAPRPVPTPPQAPPPPVKGGCGEDEGGDASAAEAVTTPAPTAELVVARRQSQINLNRFLAAAPSGLTAVLKQPSRGDLEPMRSQGSASLQVAFSLHQQQAHQQQQAQQQAQQQQYSQTTPGSGGGESPPVRPLRERRRTMAASELAATLQNIDVTQAAMIMMPARLRQELVGAQQSLSQPLPNMASLPAPLRASAPLATANLSADSYSLATVLGPSSGAAGTAPPRLERKPSLILEAVKVTQQQQQQPAPPTRGSVASESTPRNQAAGLSGGGDSAERGPGGPLASRRGMTAAPALSQQQLQQIQQLGGPSRGSMAVNGSPPSPTHGPLRRSEVGEPALRARGSVPLGFEAPGAAAPVLMSNGGHPLSPSVNSNGVGYLLPGAPSSKDLRRAAGGGLAARGSEMLPMSLSGGDDDGQYDAVRLPVIGGNGAPARRVAVDPKADEGRSVHVGGRGGLTAADVAALSEAISSYQTEAARLRAMAVRKVDSRIKRAVMDRRLTADEEAAAGPGSLLDGSIAGNLLTPLTRPQQPASGNSSRGSAQQPASRGGPRSAAQAGGGGPGAGAGGGAGGGSVDSLMRARTRLQDTEAETNEELSQMRKSAHLAPRLIAAELMSEPSVPRRR